MPFTANNKILDRDTLAARCADLRTAERRIVCTNGCFDILHVGHVELLREAKAQGDYLVVGVNSDASVQRLKGPERPINDQEARARVLAALGDVDAVSIFEEDTPIELIEAVQPHVHVKGGDYQPDDLPEAATVRALGGEVVIVPLREGFSTTGTLRKLRGGETTQQPDAGLTYSAVVIPARYASTRFPGKPLELLGFVPVIEHVARSATRTRADAVVVATDDERIATVVRAAFAPDEVDVVMTSDAHPTGTDRIAEAVQKRFGEQLDSRLIVVNVQGDEPFINPQHIDLLLGAMQADPSLAMATLATPLRDAAQIEDPNVVKVVTAENGDALYFSRWPIPYQREASGGDAQRLRHLGVYAYSAQWLLKMAKLPPTPLEETEKLEQLRALENGERIRVLVVDDVVSIAIDTPADLAAAEEYLQKQPAFFT